MRIYNSGYRKGYGEGSSNKLSEKTIQCTHPGCNKMFAKKEFIEQHIKLKHNVINIETTSVYIVTDHAYERAKERMGWSRESIERMAEKAFCSGIPAKHIRTSLKGDVIDYGRKTSFIYGEYIYHFSDRKLVTLYKILPAMLEQIKKYDKRT